MCNTFWMLYTAWAYLYNHNMKSIHLNWITNSYLNKITNAFSYKCLDILISYKCLDILISYKCLDILISYKCLDILISYKCLDILISYKCLDILISYKCLDILISYKCLHILISYKCLDILIRKGYSYTILCYFKVQREEKGAILQVIIKRRGILWLQIGYIRTCPLVLQKWVCLTTKSLLTGHVPAIFNF